MHIELSDTPEELAIRAAKAGADHIRSALEKRGRANIILATGASQIATLEALIAQTDIDWSKVNAFHLDEYIGLPETHGASFRRYLKERVVARLPALGSFAFINGDEADTGAEVARISAEISKCDIDVAFIGIGENGHLAFNDPPADFETEDPYIVVELDKKCRLQQLNEGWFSDLSEVPNVAISMSVRHILKSEVLICAVPDERKAEAVRGALEGPVSNLCPSSILQSHDKVFLYLDEGSASRLDRSRLAAPGPG